MSPSVAKAIGCRRRAGTRRRLWDRGAGGSVAVHHDRRRRGVGRGVLAPTATRWVAGGVADPAIKSTTRTGHVVHTEARHSRRLRRVSPGETPCACRHRPTVYLGTEHGKRPYLRGT